ncbi:hypothetical protein GGQ92_002163 [Gracilibacillus halotolerans]|uniref:Prolow-density lipoprotein receptor-related protein 1-like beta-propeller domain-containing protein n=1 Tax=Gracilibacillus halotolerans TaxID=74386 RepID=A0A841RQ81_9BACI|nr:DUF5050 domain-containing protein [Gracilibacillus halotolerans]MBB6513355.1 hypothetical protein [Gracilibacillus halotolerans]
MSLENRKKVHKRRYGFFCIIIIIFLIGCSEKELTKEEAIEQTLEKLNELESYAFALNAYNVDDMGNEAEAELTGVVMNEPFVASIKVKKSPLGGLEEDSTPFYRDNMLYYEYPGMEQLIKTEVVAQTDIRKAVNTLFQEEQELEFKSEEEVYIFEYTSDKKDKNISLLEDIYPEFIHASSPEQGLGFILTNSFYDPIILDVKIEISQQNLNIVKLHIEYTGESNVMKENPPQYSNILTMDLNNHNKIEEISLPYNQLEEATTFIEHFLGPLDELVDKKETEEETEEKNEKEDAQLGNLQGNHLNGGLWAADSEWLYYSNSIHGINRMSLDGSDSEFLYNTSGRNFNLIDDKIYYIDLLDDERMYQMNKDGTNRQLIQDVYATNLMARDNWLYYITSSEDETDYSTHLEKYNVESELGFGERILENISQFTINEDKIFYKKSQDNQLYYTDINVNVFTQEPENLIEGVYAGGFLVINDWIYYENLNANYKLYRKNMKTDQMEELTVDEVNGFNGFNGNDDFIFYINATDNASLYKLDVSLQETEKVDEGRVIFPYLLHDHIYYMKSERSSDQNWYRVPIDGGQPELILKERE